MGVVVVGGGVDEGIRQTEMCVEAQKLKEAASAWTWR